MKKISIICNDGNKETYDFKRVTIENDVIEISINDFKTVIIDPADIESSDWLVKEVRIK